MSIAELARPEIRNLRAYQSAAACDLGVKLNANEAPLATGTVDQKGLNRYPARRPARLTRIMADHYGVAVDNVLVTRGSSEGIDLLIRTFCTAGKDSVLLTPPVFDMYQVYASIQGAQIINVSLRAEDDFAVDAGALLNACDDCTKLVFLCSPNNPLGVTVPKNRILKILRKRTGKSVVILDEAYIEYSDANSLACLVADYDNLVVLRTLSKGLALAGARCGAVIASAGLIRLLDGVLAPYALSSPAIESAEAALSSTQLALARTAIHKIIDERERLRRQLTTCNAVEKIWPSQANFLFVRFACLEDVTCCLEDAGIAIRTYGNDSSMKDCARITVSLESDNNQLVDVIRGLN
jgi:histidinol-phosphate aminotransferase